MRRAHQVDQNQRAIVQALEAMYCSVADTSALGDDFPDLIVGYRKRNILLEVKNPAQPKGKRRLRPGQQTWHDAWRGQVAVVETVEEAIAAVQIEGTGWR